MDLLVETQRVNNRERLGGTWFRILPACCHDGGFKVVLCHFSTALKAPFPAVSGSLTSTQSHPNRRGGILPKVYGDKLQRTEGHARINPQLHHTPTIIRIKISKLIQSPSTLQVVGRERKWILKWETMGRRIQETGTTTATNNGYDGMGVPADPIQGSLKDSSGYGEEELNMGSSQALSRRGIMISSMGIWAALPPPHPCVGSELSRSFFDLLWSGPKMCWT